MAANKQTLFERATALVSGWLTRRPMPQPKGPAPGGPDKPNPEDQVVGPGVANWGGFVVETELNPALRGQQRAVTYQNAIANDDTVGTGVRAILTLLGDVEWEVEPAKVDPPKAADPSKPIASTRDQGAYRKAFPIGQAGKKEQAAAAKAPKPGKPGDKPQVPKDPATAAAEMAMQVDPETQAKRDEALEKSEWVRKVLFEEIKTPWPQLMRRMATFVFFGHSIHEWVGQKREEDGSYGLKDLVSVPQTTIEGWDMDPKTGELKGVVQVTPQDNSARYLCRGKMAYACDDALAMGDPRGLGRLRHLIDKTRQKQRLEQLEGIGYEVDLRGVPYARAPIAAMKEKILKKEPGWTQATMDEALQPIKDFMEGHVRNPELGLTLDSTPYRSVGENREPSAMPMWDMKLLSSEGAPHGEVHTAIERKGVEIARVLAAEGFFLGNGDGSQAMSGDKLKMTAAVCNAALTDIAEMLNRDVVHPLWVWNGWDMAMKPKLKPARVDVEDVEKVANTMASTARAAMTPDDPAQDAIRRRLRLPVLPQEQKQREIDRQAQTMASQLEAEAASTKATLDPPAKPAPAGGAKKPAKKPTKK